ncbi:ABC-2 family transporter protein [Candidatus Roizmanbacteria bacterium]|nr:ABC-2 family transporter protein [Candidatus Roizmanbacteria bacterium]
MREYLTVFTTTIKEYFVYRLNFVLWRFRVVLNLLLPLFLWTSVFDKNAVIGSYDKIAFVSYLLYGNIIATFVFGTRTFDISSDINDGKIINILLKPVSFFSYYFAREIADKAVNLFFAIFEILFLIWFFKLTIVMPNNFILFSIIFLNGVLISYFINLSLSFIGFWTTEVWPIRFIFIVLLFFAAGNYFPLDILPSPIYKFILATPFPYMFYLPAKILIDKRLTIGNFFPQLLFSYFWLFFSYFIARFIWQKGIKNFSFWGR